jgi:flagellar FliJ protein
MKKFKFTLDPILKLRKAKEDKLKRELGLIVSEVTRLKDYVEELKNRLQQGYTSQESVAQEPDAKAGMLRFYPMFFEGIKADLKKTNDQIKIEEEKYKTKLNELARAMGDVKIMDGLKQDKFSDWKKKREKKINQDLEELFLTTKHFRKIKQGESI